MRNCLILSLLLGVPGAAYGYTDPGTGIFVYQAIMATVLGGAWAVRRAIGRIFHKSDLTVERD